MNKIYHSIIYGSDFSYKSLEEAARYNFVFFKAIDLNALKKVVKHRNKNKKRAVDDSVLLNKIPRGKKVRFRCYDEWYFTGVVDCIIKTRRGRRDRYLKINITDQVCAYFLISGRGEERKATWLEVIQ